MSTESHWSNEGGTGSMNFLDTALDSTFKTGVWKDCPLLAMRSNPTIAYEVFEDFTNIDAATMAGYTVTQQGTGTFALDTTIRGVALADCNSGTQHQGVNVQKLGNCFLAAADKDIWFEAEFKVVDTAITPQMFVGLAAADTTLLPNGDLDSASTEFIGFAVETTLAGVMSFYETKNTAELSDSLGTTGTLVEDTFIRVGFKVTGITGIQAYINGVEQTLTNVVASGIPVTSVMTPSFVCQTDSTTDPILHLDWYRCVQLR